MRLWRDQVFSRAARDVALAVALICAVPRNARAHDPCDYQGVTTLLFASGVADPLDTVRQPPALRGRDARALDTLAAGWRTRHSILSVVGHVDAAEAAADLDLDVRRAAAVRQALEQRGVGPGWIRVAGEGFRDARVPGAKGPNLQNRFVWVSAPDAGAGCLGVPGRYTAQ